jgi:phosphatidylglycerol lysyltransferase
MFKNSKNLVDIRIVRLGMSLLIGLSGLLSIIGSTHYGHRFAHNSIITGIEPAWLTSHSVAIGFALLYLSRKILQGESTAYKISLVLALLQIVKYMFVVPRLPLVIVYSLILVILLFSSGYFDRKGNPSSFLFRLKNVAVTILVSSVAIGLFGVINNIREPQIWRNGAYSAGRIIMRVSLLEVSDDSQDTFQARIFNQALTTAGVAVYAWVFLGLFLPSLHRKSYAEEHEHRAMLDLLNKYGTSSEDSLKIWPKDKNYWFDSSGSTGVAYKQYKSFVFALDSPVGPSSEKLKVSMDFKNYCRQHGWTLVWLLCDEFDAKTYSKAGLKTLTIGASAVVDLDEYAITTVRSKYWRWIRNKNTKLDLKYDFLMPPHSNITKQQIKEVSSEWMNLEGREERTFALGYYDEDFLSTCTLHVLRHCDGKIVAFANQLPTFNSNLQATIDMMRCMPGYDGAMAFLLSEMLLSLKLNSQFTSFDLGFVPLAHTEEKIGKKAILGLFKTLMENFFSAKGLKQFKNKFEPKWQENFIAWDGDLLDLPLIAKALDKVLKSK